MAPPSGDRDGCRQHGFSLVETVIALFLLGTGVTAVLTALQVSVAWSAQQQELATMERTLQEVAEHVRAAPFAFGAGTDYVGDAAPGATQTSLRCWNGSVSEPAFGTATCGSSPVQVVGIRVTLDDGSARTTEVVKRRHPE
jgi:prepilin-type N-terminal cleavage/methylation domain-containing protein